MGDEVADDSHEDDNLIMLEEVKPNSANDPAKIEEANDSGEIPEEAHYGYTKAEEQPSLNQASTNATPATQEPPKEAAKVAEPAAPIVAVQTQEPKASIPKAEKAEIKREDADKIGNEARIQGQKDAARAQDFVKGILPEKKHNGSELSRPGTVPFGDLWGPDTKYSEQLANGDKDDDKQIENEDDPDDPIADDEGFTNQFKVKERDLAEWNRRPTLITSYVQLDQNMKMGEPSLVELSENADRFSDEIADGVDDDDAEVEDPNENDVTNVSFLQLDDDVNMGEGKAGKEGPAPAW